MENNEIKFFRVEVDEATIHFVAYLSCGEKGFGVAINAIQDNKEAGLVWFNLPPFQIFQFAQEGKTWSNVVESAITLFKSRDWPRRLLLSEEEYPKFVDNF